MKPATNDDRRDGTRCCCKPNGVLFANWLEWLASIYSANLARATITFQLPALDEAALIPFDKYIYIYLNCVGDEDLLFIIIIILRYAIGAQLGIDAPFRP